MIEIVLVRDALDVTRPFPHIQNLDGTTVVDLGPGTFPVVLPSGHSLFRRLTGNFLEIVIGRPESAKQEER